MQKKTTGKEASASNHCYWDNTALRGRKQISVVSALAVITQR